MNYFYSLIQNIYQIPIFILGSGKEYQEIGLFF